jgi:molybdenum cofactor synthesis domain-containing protein
MNRTMQVAILTVSDRCSRGQMRDTASPALREILQDKLSASVGLVACVPDDIRSIADQLRRWAFEENELDLILTTGGTGLGPRDVTPEATAAVLERSHPGLLELARLRCFAKTPRAFLSRGEAGTIARTLVINLPGSQRGATEFLEALLDVLPHAIQMLRGEQGDHVPPPVSAGPSSAGKDKTA